MIEILPRYVAVPDWSCTVLYEFVRPEVALAMTNAKGTNDPPLYRFSTHL